MEVITLQNGSRLNERQFIKYFEKKVFYTIRKFNLFEKLRGKCNKLDVKELFSRSRVGNTNISKECLDDISVSIIKEMMKKQGKKELKKLLPQYSNVIRPFYLMSKEEMNLYARLKKIKIPENHQGKNSINHLPLLSFLNELEKNQKNVKNSIVSSLLKIENLI